MSAGSHCWKQRSSQAVFLWSIEHRDQTMLLQAVEPDTETICSLHFFVGPSPAKCVGCLDDLRRMCFCHVGCNTVSWRLAAASHRFIEAGGQMPCVHAQKAKWFSTCPCGELCTSDESIFQIPPCAAQHTRTLRALFWHMTGCLECMASLGLQQRRGGWNG